MKIYTVRTYFFATVTAGLEDVLAEEISELGINMNLIKSERRKVLFESRKNINELLKLRCADNIYCVVCELPVGHHKKDLEQYAFDISRIEWKKILSSFNVNDSNLTISASRSGKATYSRFDIENATKTVLSKTGYSIVDKSGSALNMRVDFFNDSCRISIKLTNADFRYRGDTHIYAKGCIRPTVASAIVRISKPSKTDIFYDPFCGSGTIINAREKYPSKRILASDIEEEKVSIAQKNCDGTPKIFKCNALNTTSKSESIDVIVTNPPWNKQITIDNIERFYIGFIAEAKRILNKDGQIILLTDCYDEVLKAAQQNDMDCKVLFKLSLHGLRPMIFKITNKDDNMNYGSLTCANEYAKQYKIEEWVHKFLLNDGDNKEFSNGLKLFDRYFIGPITMPLKLFKRCCGPEESMKYRVDYSRFEFHVVKLMDAIKSSADLPPLIINYADNEFELSDGNHRFEAYSRLGINECCVIIWITEKRDYDMFLKEYNKYLIDAI